jgi:hypothetical protein
MKTESLRDQLNDKARAMLDWPLAYLQRWLPARDGVSRQWAVSSVIAASDRLGLFLGDIAGLGFAFQDLCYSSVLARIRHLWVPSSLWVGVLDER